jgi:hypothetical protein
MPVGGSNVCSVERLFGQHSWGRLSSVSCAGRAFGGFYFPTNFRTNFVVRMGQCVLP